MDFVCCHEKVKSEVSVTTYCTLLLPFKDAVTPTVTIQVIKLEFSEAVNLEKVQVASASIKRNS